MNDPEAGSNEDTLSVAEIDELVARVLSSRPPSATVWNRCLAACLLCFVLGGAAGLAVPEWNRPYEHDFEQYRCGTDYLMVPPVLVLNAPLDVRHDRVPGT